ncbi:MAG: FIST signal transduction protein, partial [Bacteroidota bacterium]
MAQAPQLVLAFGNRKVIADPKRFEELKSFYPNSNIVSCSTAGEIIGSKVVDNSIIATAVYFEKTNVRMAKTSVLQEAQNDFLAGQHLAERLEGEDLCHVFIISDGQKVNGTELVRGMNQYHQGRIPITGGLAGDGPNFEKTLVGINEAPTEGNIVAIGFYGTQLKVGHGSKGGWDPFGPERLVTKSTHNILYELDNQSALQLYKKYLGPLSAELPSSALLFPLCIRLGESKELLVRTILSVDERNQSMTFAGD